MSVALDGAAIRLLAPSRIEDGEALLSGLRQDPARPIDVTRAGRLHTAVAQVLLAFRPRLIGPADDAFVADWVLPSLALAATEATEEFSRRVEPGNPGTD